MSVSNVRPKGLEETVSILDTLFWSIQPQHGVITGAYYRADCRFGQVYDGAQGYHGVLEVVVKNDGKLALVQFDEYNSPEYYIRIHQNLSKKYSDYCFFQAGKKRTEQTGVVLVNGISAVEAQMLEENRLTGEFSLITGASNSVKRGMLPLAKELAAKLPQGTDKHYFGIAEPVEQGITGRLQVVTQKGRIISCKYDEIFSDTPEEVERPEYRCFYRQSKYFSPTFVSSCAAGFNAVFDLLEQHVIDKQDLTDLAGLPFLDGDRACEEYPHYRSLAEKLKRIMEKDVPSGQQA